MKHRSKVLGLIAAMTFSLLAGMSLAPGAFAATSLTWTGHTGDDYWSAPGNWSGGTPTTDESLGTLTFGDLGTPCDNDRTSRFACYGGENDIANLSANGIDIDDSGDYQMYGSAITVGTGGITAAPGSSDPFVLRPDHDKGPGQAARKASLFGHSESLAAPLLQGIGAFDGGSFSQLDLPIVLSAGQSWSILATDEDEGYAGLEVASIAGDYPLSLNFTQDASLFIGGDTETGAITASGEGELLPGDSINGASANPIKLENDASLDIADTGSKSGPLTVVSGSSVNVGQGFVPAATLAVRGGVTFDSTATARLFIEQPGTKPRTDYSQLTASGNVDLASAKLKLYQGLASGYGCDDLHAKDVDTLLSTTGTLTGTFAGIPNGTAVTIRNECNNGKVSATAVINYTSHAVTATIKTGGDAGNVPVLLKEPRISGKPQAGHTLTVSLGTWRNKPTSYTFDWYSCNLRGNCSRMHGVKRNTVKLTAADVGRFVAVALTGKNKAGQASAYAQELSPIKAA